MSIFDNEEEREDCPGCKNGNNNKHRGTYVKVMNWATKKSIKFINLLKEKK